MIEAKPHRYYGLEYSQSVGQMAALAGVSIRTMKDCLKLREMGYDNLTALGWTAAQCFAHAGQKRKRRAMPKVGDLDEAVCEIKRLRELLLDIGVDPTVPPLPDALALVPLLILFLILPVTGI